MQKIILLIATFYVCSHSFSQNGRQGAKTVSKPGAKTEKVTKEKPVLQVPTSNDTKANESNDGAIQSQNNQATPCKALAAAGSIYELSALKWQDTVAPKYMCEYKGDVLLIVNIAAKCGFTPQMAGLEVLEDTFAAQGLHVLGFLSDDFAHQGGTDNDVSACTMQYSCTFEVFSKDHVRKSGTELPQAVWGWLLAQQNPGPASSIAPDWNFHKYLISREGKLIAHWSSAEYPGDDPNNPNDSFDTNSIVMKIKEELAKESPSTSH